MPTIKRAAVQVATSNFAQVIYCGLMIASPLLLWAFNLNSQTI